MALSTKDFDRVRLIEFNRPEQLNAFNYQQFAETREALSAAQVDSNIAVVVLTGAGEAFSAGADLEDMRRKIKGTKEQTTTAVDTGSERALGHRPGELVVNLYKVIKLLNQSMDIRVYLFIYFNIVIIISNTPCTR